MNMYQEFVRRRLFPTKQEKKQQWLRKCYITFKILGALLLSNLIAIQSVQHDDLRMFWIGVLVVQVLSFLPCYIMLVLVNNIIDYEHIDNYHGYKL